MRLFLQACQLSQAPLLFRAVSHGVLPTSSLNKLMFALLKYRVCTLPLASLRRTGSWTTSWPVQTRLLLIITPLTSSFSFVSSRTRRAWPLVGSSSICVKKLLLTHSRNLFGLVSSHCVVPSADIKEGEVFPKQLHCDQISSSCLKKFHPVPHLIGWSVTNTLLTLTGLSSDPDPQA